ncbi:adenylyltransferase/cytidyltransferase family protein [Cytobacillus oceanisediminis]|uniref:adenylyltransferase/cytidyltransferase family protein n=1 Tax=Cytobacillus oceanisediminis TaxID=665099 RepID=UPI001C23AED2|nr:adenylyltransferase/cytidyltransferase family protein [Cytobacillus oceanisediminis]MBU8772048.1 adenylyltransferase/cytidyltransferase family protein [Cytobacillus oceanisediminis]
MDKKIYNLPDLLTALLDKRPNNRIILTNGCFDILHVGHIECLAGAKELGDILIVGINSDKSLSSLKKREPIFTHEHRMEILAALGCVDYVFTFNELSFEKYITLIKPDIYVKGPDYTGKVTPESLLAQKLDIKYELVGKTKKQSTSNLIDFISKSNI